MTQISATIASQEISAKISEQDINVTSASGANGLRFLETDGSPDVSSVQVVTVDSGGLTDDGSSKVTLNLLSKAGGTMTGDIDMDSNDLLNPGNLYTSSEVDSLIAPFSPHDDGTSAGQMSFWNGSKWTYTETSELYWDDTNKRLGIGTDSPDVALHVVQTAQASTTEDIVKFGVSDSSSYVSLFNNTSADNQFLPSFYSMQADNANTAALQFMGDVNGADTTSAPCVSFQSRQGLAAVDNRSIAGFYNYGTQVANFDNDGTLTLYDSTGADSTTIATDGDGYLQITPSGNRVVINTTANNALTPQFEVNDGARGKLYITDGTNTTSNYLPTIVFEGSGNSGNNGFLSSRMLSADDSLNPSRAAMIFDARLVTGAKITTANLFQWKNYTDVLMTIDASGNVGIGTASPDRKLDVLDTSNPQLRLTHTDGSVYTDMQTDSSGNLYISNTGENVAIGNSAGNGQTRTTAVGAYALFGNSGDYSSGFGYAALQNNTGAYSNGFGFYALRNNTGERSNGFGYYSLRYNTGAYSNGVGYYTLYNNTGERSNGFGYYALYSNTGAYSNGFGLSALYNNTGVYSNGFGYLALQNNTGDNATGLGYQTLRYNQNDNNTAIGYNAWADFLEDTSGNQTFDNTDIDTGTDRITISSHGLGDADSYVNLKYTEGTSAITGLTDGEIYQVKIIDANTIGFYEADGPDGDNRGTNITDAGSGTGHTLTPQFDYSDSIVIGNNINPTSSNQINIGGELLVDTSTGNTRLGTSDNDKTFWGAGSDASIYYDGTDLIIDPREVGSGVLDVRAPIQITDVGSLLGTPQAGTFEFDNDRMYITNVGTQRAIDRTSDVITSTTTVSNTATETTIYTGTLGADDLKAGNVVKVRTNGVISNATASDDITINVYIGSTQVSTFNPAIGNVTEAHWDANFELTVRSVGVSGSIAFNGVTDIDTSKQYDDSIETIDTTAAENLTVKVQWDNAKSDNSISIYQGYMEFKN
jgi:hypothetical protein